MHKNFIFFIKHCIFCRITIGAIWLVAAAYSAPYLIVFDIIVIPNNNTTMSFCLQVGEHTFNFAAYDTFTFALWYLLPLALITFMYSRVSEIANL